MADTMNPQNYANMIAALNTFASKTSQTTTELYAACSTCAQVLGEGDLVSQNLTANAGRIAAKYAKLAKTAQAIADQMQQELETYYERARQIWNDDNSADDDY